MKQLISAETIKTAWQNGQKSMVFSIREHIVTPEAKEVAKELGMELVVQDGLSANTAACGVATACQPCQDPTEVIRAAVIAQLGSASVSEEIISQLIQKVLNEQKLPACGGEGIGTHQAMYTTAKGIKRIKGSQIPMGIMAEAGIEKQIGLADVVTEADGSPMAAGYMSWKNASFPWTLNYDEINVVLEGELHIKSGGETSIAKAGDVLFIPKGSSIEFGTPTFVRFVFISYPVNWQSA